MEFSPSVNERAVDLNTDSDCDSDSSDSECSDSSSTSSLGPEDFDFLAETEALEHCIKEEAVKISTIKLF